MTLGDYCDSATAHGLMYVGDGSLRPAFRGAWAAAAAAAMAAAAYAVHATLGAWEPLEVGLDMSASKVRGKIKKEILQGN